MSLYALQISCQNWQKCRLYHNVLFSVSIEQYLMDELSKTGTEEFSDCNTVKTFSSYEKERARVRESYRNERKLYVGLFLSSCILCFTSIIIHKILN